MNIFGAMYDKTMQWSKHRFAVFWLSFVSFIEAIFFPIPPDVMLIPMSMSKPKSAFRFALYTAVASVVGGMIGYAIGYYAFDWVQGYIQQWGYQAAWEQAMAWFKEWGVLVVFVAGFSPIPYKVFTICAGDANGVYPLCDYRVCIAFCSFYFSGKTRRMGRRKIRREIT